MAFSTLSLGMLAALAALSTVRNRGLAVGSPPPSFAATVISLASLEKIRPRFSSRAPFLRLIVLHLLWPDMTADNSRLGSRGVVLWYCRGLSPVVPLREKY